MKADRLRVENAQMRSLGASWAQGCLFYRHLVCIEAPKRHLGFPGMSQPLTFEFPMLGGPIYVYILRIANARVPFRFLFRYGMKQPSF